MRPTAAIILAAGRSTRMITDLPKVLHEVCGRPMLAYVLDACREAGVGRIFIVVGYRAEAVREAFADHPDITWVEQPQQQGTGHAVMCCEPVLADFDNSGGQDLVFFYRAEGTQRETLAMVHDPGTKGVSEIDRPPLFYPVCSDGARGGPIPADIDGDGGYELIAFGEGPAVLALEANGNLVDTYPRRNIQVPVSFSKDHLSLVDLDGDGGLDLLYTTRRSTLVDESSGVRNYEYFYAFDALASSGGRIPGFPVGSRIDHPLWCGLSQMDDDPQLELWVVSGEAIDACEVGAGGSAPSVWWQGEYRDGDHSNAVWESAVPFRAPPWTPLLPAEQCYNWPNPARGWTSIRYTLSAPATVKVDIFDITGERVTTLHGSGTPGLPSEIIWNLDGVARGGYIAVIKAQGGGRSETRTVKIAVVK